MSNSNTTKATISHHAAAAKAVRAFMKAQGIKGAVKASRSAGTSSIRVSLTNGTPSQTATVTEFAKQYQYGHFDGMYDSYEFSNCIEGLPQVKYVFVEAEFDTETKQKALDALCTEFNLPAMVYESAPYDVTICGEKQNTYSAMRAVLLGSHYPHVPLWEVAA